jgi:hypothetical protein
MSAARPPRPEGEPAEPGIADRLAAVLDRADEGDITVRSLVEAFGPGAFGLLLVLLNLPSVVFAPPVLAGIAAVPTAFFGAQMLLGHARPWLPEVLLDRTVAAPALRRVLATARPLLDRLDRMGRPRLAFAAGPVAFRLFGLSAIVAALIVLVPIPGTNVLPALSLVTMAVASIRRDGLLFLVGLALGVAGLALVVAAMGLAVEALRWLWSALA